MPRTTPVSATPRLPGNKPNGESEDESPAGIKRNPPADAPPEKKVQTGSEALSIENPFLKRMADFIYNPNDPLDTVNRIGNLTGAIPNIFGAINSLVPMIDLDQETSEKVFGWFSKVSTMTRGSTGVIDCFNKKNLLPLIGSALEIPTALTTSGFNLWMKRGWCQSIRQMQSLTKRLGMVIEKDGKQIKLDSEDGDNFNKYGLGFLDGFKCSLNGIKQVYSEIFTNPLKTDPDKSQKENSNSLFTRAMLGCSTIQFLGPCVALLSENVGAVIRDIGGALVDVAYMLDKKDYRVAGALWSGSAVADISKRYASSDGSRGFLHHLSLFTDPIAAIFESKGNFGIQEVKNERKSPAKVQNAKILTSSS